MSSNQIHSDVIDTSTASNVFLNEKANTTIQKREYSSTATVTEVNEKPMDKMMLVSSVHRESEQCIKEDFLFNSDIISLSEENDGNMVTPSNSTSCNNTSTSSSSPTRSTADLEKPIPANILFDNEQDTAEVAAIPATLATPKRRGIMLHSSLFFSPLQRLDTGSKKKKKTSTSTSKKRSSSLLAIRYGSATKKKRNKKRKTTPNFQKKSNKTTHNDDDVLDQITSKHSDTSSNHKKQSANSKQSRGKNIDLEKGIDVESSTQCLDQTNVSSMGTFPRKIQIPTSAIEYGTQFSIETFQHFQITPLREADRVWKRMNLEIGFHGISCAHCDGRNGKKRGGRCGRYFPSSLKTLADPNKMLFTMYRHLQRCENVAPQDKDRLDDLFETHDAERLAQIRGTQKKFYEFIWKELRKGNGLTNSYTADKDSGDDCD